MIGTKVQWLIDNVVVHEETLPNTGSLYYDVAFMTINGSFTDMEIVYDSSILTTEIKYQYIDGKPTIPTLPHQITLTEVREGVGSDPILFTLPERLLSQVVM
jgi:hypothetical protein